MYVYCIVLYKYKMRVNKGTYIKFDIYTRIGTFFVTQLLSV